MNAAEYKRGQLNKVLIGGYFGFNNAGDELILSAEIKLIRAALPDVEITVVSGNPGSTRSRHNVKAIHWNDPTVLADEIKRTDLCMLGGGGLIHDYWGVTSDDLFVPGKVGLSGYLSIPLLAALYGIPSAAFAVGVGPINHAQSKELICLSMSICDEISVRDEYSYKTLKDLYKESKFQMPPVRVAADPTFSLPLRQDGLHKELASIKSLLEPDRQTLGVSLRYWDIDVDPDTYCQEVAAALDKFISSTSYQVLFIPFQKTSQSSYEDDISIHIKVQSMMRMAKDTYALKKSLDPSFIPVLLNECDRYLGMRYHSVVLAFMHGIPTVGLAYDRKVEAIYRESGHDALLLHKYQWTADEIFACLQEAGNSNFRSSIGGFVNSKQNLPLLEIQHIIKKLESREDRRYSNSEVVDLVLDNLSASTGLREEIGILSEQAKVLDEKLGNAEAEAARHQQEAKEIKRANDYRESQVRDLSSQNYRLENELSAIRGTRGFKHLAAYWSFVNRIFPVGSHRRNYILRFLRFLRDTFREVRRSSSKIDLDSLREIDRAFDAWNEAVRDCSTNRTILMFSTTAWDRTSGQRSQNLASEYAKRGVPIIYCYWRWDRNLWRFQRSQERGVIRVPIDLFLEKYDRFLEAHDDIERIILFEFPYPDFFNVLADADSHGWLTIYDVVDDWSDFNRVGQAPWFEKEFEEYITQNVDVLTVVSEKLNQTARSSLGRSGRLVANGFRDGIGQIRSSIQLEKGEITLGYFGSLTQSWFDWDLVINVAQSKPSWKIYLIGILDHGHKPSTPENVTLLGVQDQEKLAAFTQNWDVGIIPFKQIPLAEASDPIKTYEYLAMGLPVVMSGAKSHPGIRTCTREVDSLEEFLSAVEELKSANDCLGDEAFEILAEHTWAARVDTLENLIDESIPQIRWKTGLDIEPVS